MVSTVFADTTASVTELKKNPMGTVAAGRGGSVAILNHNRPAFYCVPVDLYNRMMEMLDVLEDVELNAIADLRRDSPEIEVSLDDL